MGPWLVGEWLACGLVLLLVYHAVVADLWTVWMTNQDFSHGILVAPFVLYLGWNRRKVLARTELSPSWAGAVLLVAAFAMRLAGLRYYYGSLERLSLVVAVWGAVLLLAGREVFRNLRGPLILLLLMVPPPSRAAEAITLPLQRMAARSAASVLSAMGWDVIREGNVLRLPLQSLEVAAACSGLRMIFAIVTLGGAMVCLMNRPRWERMVLVASTVPLAIAINVVRVIATAILSDTWPTAFSPARIHDVAGWLMMPVALTLLWLEQRFLRSLFVDPDAVS
ncbi:MAG TPA: exosortase/archaeosortase family protein [Planctomycetota bacterium]|nr:exosortase/archaeosortase family protein [Planctomycetota bacterium]HRR81542.1 exosortase/archaeosortase family protein [Planctomycetota bacterium]HRT97342.1 exosortase/archaeosortase family protein [Planctomycetota bacterium]